MEMEDEFVCVECGRKAKSIFKRYDNGITKLSRCVSYWILYFHLFTEIQDKTAANPNFFDVKLNNREPDFPL